MDTLTEGNNCALSKFYTFSIPKIGKEKDNDKDKKQKEI